MNRSYSRRELYAFGEPLGESVTRRKAGGGLILGDGGGGGGGQPASQTQVSDLPEWAKPYAKETLGKAQALTQTPYQTYGSERIAGFDPMQQQSFQGAAQMQPSALGAQAGQLAGAATMGALGTNYNPYETGGFTSQTAGQYMNPYLEQAMEPQLREAQRASQMQGVADQGQAVRAGAFGGSRQGIIEAERQRNLGQLQGDIRAKGYMSAFEQAQQNFAREQQLREQSRQYGAGLGMQGLQTALQGAGQMGALGGQQFAQGMDINKLQNLYGQQQQAQEQAGLTQKYADFQTQQKYPYQQLEFMSNILRGTPMGTVNTLYGAPGPNMAQQIGALGAGAYGLSKVFADGGAVDGYAEGGVTSDQNVESILSKLSNEQLAQAKQIALATRDMERVQMIDQELAERASMSQGLGGAFNQLPQEAQDNVIQAANGGMLSFANGGYSPPDYAPLYAEASRLAGEIPATAYTAPTQEETTAGIRAQRGLVQEMMGTDKLSPFMEEIAAQRKTLKEGGERSKGLAALAAIEPLLKGRGAASIGAGVSKFGSELGRLEKEDRDADRLLMASQVQLATAQQARADGQFDKASSLFNRAEETKEKALAAKRDILGKQATLQATMGGQALSAAGSKFATEEQARTSRYVADSSAKTQRDVSNKPGEAERYADRLDKIMRGESYYGGKTGEEGAKLYEKSFAKYGAGRMGVGDGGQKPATAPNEAQVSQAVSGAMRQDPDAKRIGAAMELVELQMSSYTRKGKPVPPELNARLKALQGQKDKLRNEFEAKIRKSGAASAEGGPKPLPMPASQSELVDGGLYQTARGTAKWDASASQFIPVN